MSDNTAMVWMVVAVSGSIAAMVVAFMFFAYSERRDRRRR